MKTFNKLLIASALAAAFAAPAFAGEEATLAERNVYSNAQHGWTQSYAMDKSASKMSHRGWHWTKDQSVASQR